jgi:apolipoprotein N-acyltransferase
VNLSNEGWFGDYDGNRLAHVQMARFRCIENRIQMVRAANTGGSVHIDSNGIIIAVAGDGRNDLREAGWVMATTSVDDRFTFYSRVGNVLPLSCLTVLLLIAASTWLPTRKTRPGDIA